MKTTKGPRKTFYKACSITVIFVLMLTVKMVFNNSTWNESKKGLINIEAVYEVFPALQPQSRKLLAVVECRDLHNLNTQDQKCEFVMNLDDCGKDEGFPNLNYNKFVYCDLGNAVWGAMIILIIWWLWLFVGLAVCADDFFCPSLIVISDTLRLSPNVAGATFLAFGNGAPDLFSAIAALENGDDPEMGIAGLFGAGCFVTTVVCGTVAIIKPFKAMERPFLRDVLFYMGFVYWVFFCLWRGEVTLAETIGFISAYVLYVIVVVVSGSIYKSQQKKVLEKKGINTAFDMDKATFATMISDGQVELSKLDADDEQTKKDLGNINLAFHGDKMGNEDSTRGHVPHHRETNRRLSIFLGTNEDDVPTDSDSPGDKKMSDIQEDIEEEISGEKMLNIQEEIAGEGTIGTEEQEDEEEEERNYWSEFLTMLNPIDVEEFPDMSLIWKFYEIFKCPLVFIIHLTCPVVNYEVEVTHNWCRYMQCLQCFISPTGCLLILQRLDTWIGGEFPMIGLTLIIGAALAILVFFTSSNEKKPVYHWAFAYAEFLIAMIWIYVIATEIVSLLSTFGVVFNISDAILGLTLLAWGNSIGDWIADSLMARQGYSRMGFAACYGAPIFNLSLGFGIPYLIQTIEAEDNKMTFKMSGVLLVLSFFLLGNLVLAIIILPVRKFRVEKFYGIWLMIYYIVFLTVVVLTEVGVILDGWSPSDWS